MRVDVYRAMCIGMRVSRSRYRSTCRDPARVRGVPMHPTLSSRTQVSITTTYLPLHQRALATVLVVEGGEQALLQHQQIGWRLADECNGRCPPSLAPDHGVQDRQELRREMDRRMLRNGHCAVRSSWIGHFELICESCCYFVITPQFKPILQAPRTRYGKAPIRAVTRAVGMMSRGRDED
jgi:hypothetical protein